MTSPLDCDVAIIGGGPAGSAAATVLAREGFRATIFEKEKAPRFHVGESLLPFQGKVLERLGLRQKVAAAGFMPKYGALFLSADGKCTSQIDFGDLLPPPHNFSFQVERAKFDELLLRHAESSGATVLEQHTVVDAELAESGSRLRIRRPDGSEETCSARWVIDASGQGSFIAKRFGLRVVEPELRKVAHFAHFEGGKRHQGRRAGDISLVFGRGCWFWHIPFSGDRVSIGCVMNQEAWKESTLSADEYLDAAIADCPWLADWMAGSQRVTSAHTLANFSYTAKSFVGAGWMLAGDAATFLDPVFSTGVFMALSSGEAAAKALLPGLRSGSISAARLAPYEKAMRSWTRQYFRLIRAYYQPQFPAILLSPVPVFLRAVTYFLAGSLKLPWRYRVVMEVFHLVVRFNKGYRIVPEPRAPEVAYPHG